MMVPVPVSCVAVSLYRFLSVAKLSELKSFVEDKIRSGSEASMKTINFLYK